MMQQQMFPTLPGLNSCFGDNLSLNFYDSDVLFTFSERGMNMFGGWMGLEEQIIFGLIASSINLPVYAVLDLKDEQLAETFIQEMLKVVQRRFSAERAPQGRVQAHFRSTQRGGRGEDQGLAGRVRQGAERGDAGSKENDRVASHRETHGGVLPERQGSPEPRRRPDLRDDENGCIVGAAGRAIPPVPALL